MSRRLSSGVTTVAVGEGRGGVFEWPDTPLARRLAADDAEARQRLHGARFLRYKRVAPRQTPEERKAVQRAYGAKRKALGFRYCMACKSWQTDHTTKTCPSRRSG